MSNNGSASPFVAIMNKTAQTKIVINNCFIDRLEVLHIASTALPVLAPREGGVAAGAPQSGIHHH